MIPKFWKHKIIVIKGGVIAIKSSRNQAFTGIISFSAGSLNNFQKLAKPSKMGICELVFCLVVLKWY